MIPCVNELNLMKNIKLLNEYSKKEKENKEEYNIKLGIIDKSIIIIIKEGMKSFNGQFNLNYLKEKYIQFNKFETIEEAYKEEILPSFNENKYSIKTEENNLILNIEINKNIIPFILSKNEIQKDDLINSLYIIANNYHKENKELKEIIKTLLDKVNKMEEKFNSYGNKIDTIFDYINEKKEKQNTKLLPFNFETVLKQSKIVEKEKIELLKEWLPFDKNKIKCKLIYDAKRDGDKASTFHSLCDNKESTLIVISTSDNKKIGGYLSKPFGGNKDFIADSNAFVFSLNYNEKYPSLNKGKNYQDISSMGPIFGSSCISINDNFLSNDKNYYHPYNSRYNFGKRESINDYYFTVIDLEVYDIFE